MKCITTISCANYPKLDRLTLRNGTGTMSRIDEDINEMGESSQIQDHVSADGDVATFDMLIRHMDHNEEPIKENQFMHKDEGRGTLESDKLVRKCRRKRKRLCVKKSCREEEEWSSSCSTSDGDRCSGKSSPNKRKPCQYFDANHFVILKGKEWQGVHQDPAYVAARPYSESKDLKVHSEPSTPELINEMCAASPTYSLEILSTEERIKEKEDNVYRKENQGKSLPETNISNTVTQEPTRTVNPSCLTLWKGNVNHGAYEGSPFVSVNPDLKENSLGRTGTCMTHSSRNAKHSNCSSLDEEIELFERLQEKFKDILERTSKIIEYLKKRKQRQQMEHKLGPGSGGAGGGFGKRGGNRDSENGSDREPYSGSTGIPTMQFSQGCSSNMERCAQRSCAHSQPEMCSNYGMIDRLYVPRVNPVTHHIKSCKVKKVLPFDDFSRKFDQLTNENISVQNEKEKIGSAFQNMSQGSKSCEHVQASPSSANSLKCLDRNMDLMESEQSNPNQTTSSMDGQAQENQLYESMEEVSETIKHRDKEIISTDQQCQKSPINKSDDLQQKTVEKELNIIHDIRKEHRNGEKAPLQYENVSSESPIVMIMKSMKSIHAHQQDSNLEQVISIRAMLSSSQGKCNENNALETIDLRTPQPKEGNQGISIVCCDVSEPGLAVTQISDQNFISSSIDIKSESLSLGETLDEEIVSCVQEEIARNPEPPVKRLPTIEKSATAENLSDVVKPCGTSYKREQRGCNKADMVNSFCMLQSSQQQSMDEGLSSTASLLEDLADGVKKTPQRISLSLKDMMEIVASDNEESYNEPEVLVFKRLQSEENVENDPPTQAISSITVSEADSEYFTPHSSPASSAIVSPRSAVVYKDVDSSPEKFLSSQQRQMKTVLQHTYPCNVSIQKKMSVKVRRIVQSTSIHHRGCILEDP